MEEAQSVKEILDVYAKGSGQHVNLEKCSVMFSNNCPDHYGRVIAASLGIGKNDKFGKYLGIQADFGRSKKMVFEEIRNTVALKVDGYAEQFLSTAGKEVLIKSVASALPVYTMSCFKIPRDICKKIESTLSRFWWRGNAEKGIPWVAWKKMSNSKHCGGLGFKDLLCFNLAMLAKIGWRIVCDETTLLARILKAKYFPNTTFLQAAAGSGTSWGWKGIWQGRKVLETGLRWRIGNGKSVRVHADPWLPISHAFVSKASSGLNSLHVSDLIDQVSGDWRHEEVMSCLLPQEAQVVLRMPVSKRGCHDRIIWHYTRHGRYTVSSGYKIAMDMEAKGELGRQSTGAFCTDHSHGNLWFNIWKLEVPNKLKHFVWRCCGGSLAVRSNLVRRGMRIEDRCPLCSQVGETEHHLFFMCGFAKAFWHACNMQVGTNYSGEESFLKRWTYVLERLKGQDEVVDRLVFGLWRIWKHRNDVVFNRGGDNIDSCVSAMKKQHQEYVGAMQETRRSKPPVISRAPVADSGSAPEQSTNVERPARWLRPTHGSYKLNCDGAWDPKTMKGGYGWILREFLCWMEAAGGAGDQHYSSALVAEAVAVREGLIFCVQGGFRRVEVETDAKEVVEMVLQRSQGIAEIEGIVFDIQCLCRELEAVNFTYIPRQCNEAAHTIAAFSFKHGGFHTWNECPSWLFNVLASDANVSVRL